MTWISPANDMIYPAFPVRLATLTKRKLAPRWKKKLEKYNLKSWKTGKEKGAKRQTFYNCSKHGLTAPIGFPLEMSFKMLIDIFLHYACHWIHLLYYFQITISGFRILLRGLVPGSDIILWKSEKCILGYSSRAPKNPYISFLFYRPAFLST